MNKSIVFAAAAILAGCAQAEYTPSSDGRGSYAISCPANDLRVCFAKAQETCPAGYDVLSTRRPDNPLLPMIWQDQVVVRCRS